jgi:hypothetical protein
VPWLLLQTPNISALPAALDLRLAIIRILRRRIKAQANPRRLKYPLGMSAYVGTLLVFACLLPSFAQTTQLKIEDTQGFRWRAALLESTALLGVEHGFRLATEFDSRAGLRGPFWHDYVRSVQGFRGWGDGDPLLVNYVGHPFQGAVAGYIEVQNDPQYLTAEFGSSPSYWHSRLRALAWSAAYSTQFELGPLSEASIGNVGLKPGTLGTVDLVITPIGGFGVMVAEDALDRFVVRRFEAWSERRIPRLLLRGVLNPNRSLANMLRGKVPWHRDSRPGVDVR